jgi:hypothetical protein
MRTTGPISGEWYNQCILLVISATKDLCIGDLRIRYALVKKDPLSIEVIQHSTQSRVLLLLSLMAENMYEDSHLDTGSYLQTQTKLYVREEVSHFKCEFSSQNITPETV